MFIYFYPCPYNNTLAKVPKPWEILLKRLDWKSEDKQISKEVVSFMIHFSRSTEKSIGKKQSVENVLAGCEESLCSWIYKRVFYYCHCLLICFSDIISSLRQILKISCCLCISTRSVTHTWISTLQFILNVMLLMLLMPRCALIKLVEFFNSKKIYKYKCRVFPGHCDMMCYKILQLHFITCVDLPYIGSSG